MQATGNDFIVVDSRSQKTEGRGQKLPELAKKICDRKYGIGADGLLLLEKSKKCDFKIRIFNPDGSEPEMCGNGIRCVSLFAYKNKIAGSSMKIETMAGVLSAAVTKNNIKIRMTDPDSIKLGLNVNLDGETYKVNHINTGVPHLVYYVDKIANADVSKLGKGLRNHAFFQPKGANVNFVQTLSKTSITIRTYERGVESETLACGTGSVACAIISSLVKNVASPVNVKTCGGLLKIYFSKKGKRFTDIYLEGEVHVVFNGKYEV